MPASRWRPRWRPRRATRWCCGRFSYRKPRGAAWPPRPNTRRAWNWRARFEELAKTFSKDAGSGQNGGDLDFAKAESYVPEFGSALTKLQKGQMTEVPVKSQFGWHIIRVTDRR